MVSNLQTILISLNERHEFSVEETLNQGNVVQVPEGIRRVPAPRQGPVVVMVRAFI